MKRIYLGILVLILSVSCFAQRGGLRNPAIAHGSHHLSSVDSASWVQEWKDAYYAMATPPRIDTADLFNDYIYGLDTCGVLDSLDILYIAAMNNSDNAGINIIDPDGSYNIDDGDTISFTPYEGWDGDGGNDFLNTGFNPSTDGVHYKLNDAGIFIYVREELADQYEEYEYGIREGSTDPSAYLTGLWSVTKTIYWRTNKSSSNSFVRGTATRQGFFYQERTGVSNEQLFRNNASEQNLTGSASTSLPNADFYILAGNVEGSAANFSQNSFSVFGLGSSLSESERTSLYSLTETLMDALGKGVID